MFRSYLKVAWRNLRKEKIYSLINVFGLALGVACCLLILLFVDQEWSFDKFHGNAGRLFRLLEVENKIKEGRVKVAHLPLPLGPAMEQEFPEVEHAVRIFTGGGTVSYQDRNFSEGFVFTDPAFFQVFNFPLVQGDPAQVLADPHAVVLTRRMAEKYFGEEAPVGKVLHTTNWRGPVEVVVTGVAENPPSNSSIQFDLVMHIAQFPNYERNLSLWTFFNGPTYVLLKSGVDANALTRKLADFVTRHWGEVRQHAQERGELVAGEAGMQLHLQPITKIHLDTSVSSSQEKISNPQSALILAGIAVLVLAIACINFITLAIGRSARRAKEVGVRKVLGAFRRQVAQQFWSETLLLSALAFALGLVLAELFLPVFNRFVEADLTWGRLLQSGVAPAILGLLPLLSLLAGSYPAAVLSRFQAAEVLKGTPRVRHRRALTRVLVVFQFSLAIFLIVCTSFMVRQQRFITSRSLGYQPEHVIALSSFGGGSTAGESRMLRLREALQPYPQYVSGVTGTSSSFNKGWDVNNFGDNGVERSAYFYRVDYDYLDMLGIRLQEGRNFSRDMASDLTQAVIVNEALVQEFGWQEEIAGRRLSGWNTENVPGGPVVIGVVRDYHFLSLHERIKPVVLMLDPRWPISDILVRLNAQDMPAALKVVQEKWQALAPNTPFEYTFVDQDVQRQYDEDRRWQKIITTSAALALLLACLGLFGLVTLAASNRTKEIGIRKVLGAPVLGLAGLLSSEFALLVLAANALAWPAAYFTVQHWLENFAYHASMGWWVFVLAGGITFLIALATVCAQAARAALANPVTTLRYE